MKTIYRIFVTGASLLLFLTSACNLFQVTDVKPVYQLSEDEAIKDISTAEKVLTGAYGLLNNGLDMIVYMPGMSCLMGLTFQPGSFGGTSENSFFTNSVDPDNFYVKEVYTHCYEILNVCNHLIQKVPLVKKDDPRKKEIIAEARFLRGFIHFNLLRHYGQFFDSTSKYGIVLKTSPVENIKAFPRNTVAECYKSILADLDYASHNAPDYTTAIYVSKLAALGMKAKVLMYEGAYEASAIAAKKVTTSEKVSLETDYAAIFKDKFHSKECLFATPFDAKNERNNKSFMFRAYYLPSKYYDSVLTGDKRKPACIDTTSAGALRNAKFPGATVDNQPLTAETEYFLRLDEVYLILAEDYTRNNNFSGARDALNKIRDRAGMPDITANTKSELLEAVRHEKLIELGEENGEEWFDLVRYAVEDGLNITKFKSGVKSENRYILPIPLSSINAAQGVVEQNPGY